MLWQQRSRTRHVAHSSMEELCNALAFAPHQQHQHCCMESLECCDLIADAHGLMDGLMPHRHSCCACSLQLPHICSCLWSRLLPAVAGVAAVTAPGVIDAPAGPAWADGQAAAAAGDPPEGEWGSATAGVRYLAGVTSCCDGVACGTACQGAATAHALVVEQPVCTTLQLVCMCQCCTIHHVGHPTLSQLLQLLVNR